MIKDLKENSGLDIKLEDVGLVYDQNQFPVDAKARPLAEIRDIYQDKEAENKDLYFMYRYFESTTDSQKFLNSGIEYDLTVLTSGKIGQEYIKTAGHYHEYVPGSELTYPEVYEVIDGDIEYLLQTRPDAEGNVDVVIVKPKPKDKIIVPPGYGHVSLNIGETSAVESNLQKRDLPKTADYEAFRVYEGAALFRTEEGWQNNPGYQIKSLKKVQPKEKPDFGLTRNKPLYTSFIESPEKFEWLTKPQNYDFSDIWEETEQF